MILYKTEFTVDVVHGAVDDARLDFAVKLVERELRVVADKLERILREALDRGYDSPPTVTINGDFS